MIITGNVQVSRRHLSAPRDIIIPEVITETSVKPFKALANAMHDGGKRPLAIMQISHSGRQSANMMGGRLPFEPPLAPSAVPIKPGPGVLSTLIYKSMFQTPREMTLDDVEDLVVSFVRGAKVAMLSGFDGIQLHAAHGCKHSCSLF
jgi:2,4-dienoyl-CoA reductase-like NADH-dependent reductase (Old Yellow Enzyme family)